MKAWKKISALVLALGLTAGFAACGGNDGDSSSSSGSAPAGEPERIVLSAGKTYQDALMEYFNKLYAETNVTIVYTKVQTVEEAGAIDVVSVDGTAQFQDGKWYMEQTYTRDNQTGEVKLYYGEVGGVDYAWSLTNDGETWESIVSPVDVSTVEFMFSNFEDSGYLKADGDISFNSNTGMNEVTNWGKPTLEVKIIGGKIVEYKVTDDTNAVLESGTITYGTATVGELPALTPAE